MKRRIRSYAEVSEPAGANLADQIDAQHARLHARLAGVRSIVAVASGKGGVGKSFVAAQLAATLAARGQRVGALDADLNGPSLAAMLAASRAPLRVDEEGVHPALGRDGCRIMSSDLLLAEPDSPLRWRGTGAGEFVRQSALETGMLREFLSDVVWGDLDVLIVDLPPGTDKIARTLELLPTLAAMLIVTTPSRAAAGVVARALTYVREARVPHIGTVVNMDHHTCATCGAVTPLFATAGDARSDPDDEVWGRLPFDPAAADATDRGVALPADAPLTAAFHALASRVTREIAPTPSVLP